MSIPHPDEKVNTIYKIEIMEYDRQKKEYQAQIEEMERYKIKLRSQVEMLRKRLGSETIHRYRIADYEQRINSLNIQESENIN